ncbi:transcription-repair coupling factor [Galactobacter caseinivorans]|uniref:Transcription-repair-coupling factor n=1 Tax=Galactobacter caseinivorans TaxID=2676123 RepID=A0A496PJI9_9MICC|nr:transcription-repair coupling factor [Galactobacter caseinivorans]RKW70672.1 transcription-repair coupling factor [Galactobacter caseinivorans]
MSLNGLRAALLADPTYARVRTAAQRGPGPEDEREIAAPEGLRPPLVAEIADGLRASTDAATAPLAVVVTPTGRASEDLVSSLRSYLPAGAVEEFPSWETLPHERLSPRSDTVGRRLHVLRRLHLKDQALRVVVMPVRALLQPVVAGLGALEPVRFEVGQDRDFDGGVRALADAAYARVDLVAHRGEFAVRGGIIDVFPPTEDHPVRIDFFGDEVDSITYFSVADQRSLLGEDAVLREVTCPPCREMLLTDHVRTRARKLADSMPGSRDMLEKIAEGFAVEGMESLAPLLVESMVPVATLLPRGSVSVVMDPERVSTRAHDLLETNREFLEAAWSTASDGGAAPVDLAQAGVAAAGTGFATLGQTRADVLEAGLAWWTLTALGGDEELDQEGLTQRIAAREPAAWRGDVSQMLEFVGSRMADDWSVVLVTDGPGPAQRLAELFHEANIPCQRVETMTGPPTPGLIEITQSSAGHGFVFDSLKLGFLTEADVLGRATSAAARGGKRLAARRRNAVDPLTLTEGDHIVHDQHGIGRFVELAQRKAGSGMREYLVIEYASSKRGAPGDRLFVPTDQLDQISRYVGAESPSLSKMGGSDWAQTKSKAKRAVKEIAGELIRLYSARMASRGHAYAPDTPWQQELEAAFPFVETPDQLTTIDEVKADMERPVPMDRLVSGDVGFGKTEVAVRAAFKAVQDGKQVAVLVPTTLLARQHFETFSERYAGYPVRVKALSRFQSPGESKETIAGLKDGTVDLVIGTHRLLSKEVDFKDLGLVIVDEEQRFGVEHKEALKKMRTDVDVLAMSATPIPRTLEMSLTGIRETSTLATPPEERHPVLTYVGPYTDKQVGAAIRRELMREGQVFYVHNRVSSIDAVAGQLRELVPEARIAVAHGKMGESRLEQIMVDFWERKFDVLVSTTIIETGLDIANANTLIVDRADMYGLSQLHQLRGRVGRGRERAYAYFLWNAEKPLGEVALERLKAVAAHNELGSGFQLAMKDLEIRGAGNLLGGEQSGHIAGVGFDLYLRLVGEAVSDFKGETETAPADMKIELPLNAHLPEDYVPGERLRLEAYRKLAQAATEEAVLEVIEELNDRYGELPAPALLLVDIARLRIKARAAGLHDVAAQGNFIRFAPAELPESKQMRLTRMFPGAMYKAALHTALVPFPKGKGMGGPKLEDGELLAWVHHVIDVVFAKEPAPER